MGDLEAMEVSGESDPESEEVPDHDTFASHSVEEKDEIVDTAHGALQPSEELMHFTNALISMLVNGLTEGDYIAWLRHVIESDGEDKPIALAELDIYIQFLQQNTEIVATMLRKFVGAMSSKKSHVYVQFVRLAKAVVQCGGIAKYAMKEKGACAICKRVHGLVKLEIFTGIKVATGERREGQRKAFEELKECAENSVTLEEEKASVIVCESVQKVVYAVYVMTHWPLITLETLRKEINCTEKKPREEAIAIVGEFVKNTQKTDWPLNLYLEWKYAKTVLTECVDDKTMQCILVDRGAIRGVKRRK